MSALHPITDLNREKADIGQGGRIIRARSNRDSHRQPCLGSFAALYLDRGGTPAWRQPELGFQCQDFAVRLPHDCPKWVPLAASARGFGLYNRAMLGDVF